MLELEELRNKFRMHPRATRPGVPPTRYDGTPWPTALDQCYKHYSDAKATAYRYWWAVYCSFGDDSRAWAITGYTCNFFTVEFEFRHPETGDWWVVVATGKTSQAWRIV